MITNASHPPDELPRLSVAEMQRLTATQLSLPSRLGHVLLLAGSLTLAIAIGSLWATEPSLPARTQAAFAAIVFIALAWAVFAGWVLARRQVLFGTDRILAARMGLVFSAAGAAGMAALGYWSDVGRGAYVGAALQLVLCGVAAGLLIRAKRRVEALARRRRELEVRMASPHSGHQR